jgi:hypothetical protein
MKSNPSLLRAKDYETGAASAGTEAGAVSNRLSLDPSEFPDTQNWEDGKEYTLTVKVNQISPGEFEVIEATADESPAEEAEEPAPMPMKGKSKNPAVAGLME